MKALALTFLFLLIAVNEAKVFTKCELASILKGKGMDGYHGYSLGNWICMAYHESRYNSRAVGPRNSDGSRDYGIFQINSRYWCKNNQGPTANGCNKPCSGKTPNSAYSAPEGKQNPSALVYTFQTSYSTQLEDEKWHFMLYTSCIKSRLHC
uniref:Lysozyme n=1 Tax=Naja naja TaxID=35670 RepID=A0A8C6X511_NAJNA